MSIPKHISIDLNDVNTIDTNYRAEVVAACLVEQNIPADDISIIRSGSQNSRIYKDIIAIHTGRKLETGASLLIQTNRPSMYDQLPEGLFHQAWPSETTSKQWLVNNIRKQTQEEFYARQFFRLFETELDRSRILISLKELHFDKKQTRQEFLHAFEAYWPVLKLMEPEKAILLIKTIPLFWRLRTHTKNIQRIIQLILDVQVIIETSPEKAPLPKLDIPRLGKAKAGINWMLAGKTDPHQTITLIRVIGLSKDELRTFLRKDAGLTILHFLLDNLMPADSAYCIRYEASPEACCFQLSSANRSTGSWLGITTTLNPISRHAVHESKKPS